MTRHIILSILSVYFGSINPSQAQSIFKDPVNHFSISVPKGWTTNVPSNPPSVKIILLAPIEPNQKLRDNVNLNLIDMPGENLRSASGLLVKYLSPSPGFKILDSGTIRVNGQQFFWLEETHANAQNNQPMFAAVYLTYDHNQTYVCTATASFERAAKVRSIFHQVGKSLKTR